MADYEVKTLRRFAFKAPSAPPSIQTVPVYKRKNIVLLSNGNEFLYLIVEGSIVVSSYIFVMVIPRIPVALTLGMFLCNTRTVDCNCLAFLLQFSAYFSIPLFVYGCSSSRIGRKDTNIGSNSRWEYFCFSITRESDQKQEV